MTCEVDLNKIPIVEVDNDGEIITGFMVADNYFELYVNGKLIGVDATPFTPFNSHVVRFRVKRPYTIAVLAQDWEDKLGLGMEVFQGTTWHPGDGGFVAKFSDGTATNSSWKAQSFYIAPLQHRQHPRHLPTSAGGSTRWRNCRPAGGSASRSIIRSGRMDESEFR